MTMLKTLQKLKSDRRGSPALEFALISPLFFATVLGTFEIGRALHERNKVAGSVAAASRVVAMNSGSTTADIEAAVLGELAALDANKVTVAVTDTNVAGVDFKKIVVSYSFDLLVNFGSHLSGFTLEATRYAPVIASASSSGGSSSSTSGSDPNDGTDDPAPDEPAEPTCTKKNGRCK